MVLNSAVNTDDNNKKIIKMNNPPLISAILSDHMYHSKILNY